MRRLLPGPGPNTPSDLQEDSSLLDLAPAVAGDQYGSFYLRLGTVRELTHPWNY